ncbi:hypothetical protein GJR96_05440 [Haloferax sp. MBLA0076]|uniref:Uncharacterized protein n=1 Tax=Haloferax litoreum TaxID=2666140 RepID=A0A6A8GDJ3_9EURY|nr:MULTISPECIES: hypothetical protein [Haloferax]KAB1192918.1 hypothetical protein Hfx1148_05440 [Haloferax sp. CBA1148]MRX21404.1 hypothetical protein [Haloferax litoreum]
MSHTVDGGLSANTRRDESRDERADEGRTANTARTDRPRPANGTPERTQRAARPSVSATNRLELNPKRDVVTLSMLVLGGPFLATPRPETALIGVLFVAVGVYGVVDSVAAVVGRYVRL